MNEENNMENMVNQQTINNPSNNYTAEFNTGNNGKKSNKKVILLGIAIVLVLLIAFGVFYYFKVFTRADQFYKRVLGYAIDNMVNEVDYETSKTEVALDADVERGGIKVNVKLLDAELYNDVKGEKIYVYLKDFLDKYLELDTQTQTEEQDNKAIKKYLDILKKEIFELDFSEYCSNDKVKIEINGNKINTTKNTFKIEDYELIEIIIEVFEEMKDNEKIRKYMTQEEYEDVYEALIESFEEFKDSYTDMFIYKLHIYTKDIFMTDIVRVDFDLCSINNEKDKITLTIEKESDSKWKFKLPMDENVEIYGEVNIKEDDAGNFILTIDTNENGIITLNTNFNTKYDVSLKQINSSNSSKIEELSQQDIITLVTNLQNSQLYSFVSSFISGFNGNSDFKDSSSDIDSEEWLENSNHTDSEDRNIIDNNNNLNSNDGEVVLSTYDGLKVKVNIPQGYVLDKDTSSDSRKYLDKEGASATITVSSGRVSEYYASLESNKKSYLEDEFYKNVKLSDLETKLVNNKTFYYTTFEYEYGSYGQKNSNKFIWAQISDDYVVQFQLVGIENITEEEINTMLSSLEVK